VTNNNPKAGSGTENAQKIACFPRVADYHVPVNMMIERCLGYKTITVPPTTKKTVELGSKYSPDTVCTPFKIILGNYIEALNKGANVLVAPAIGCRLGFYDVLHNEILKDLGYDFEFFNVFEYAATKSRIMRSLKEANPALTDEQFEAAFGLTVRAVIDMDILADTMRKNMGFEINKGEFEKYYKQYLSEIPHVKHTAEAEALGNKYKEIIKNIKINKPANPIRIGMVGDLYSVMDADANCHMEKWLAENHVEIIRPIDLTYLATSLFDIDKMVALSGGYVKYYIGGNANNTVALAYEMAQNKLDGIIHMKAATCSPEITAMTILQNISKDFNIPIIYFTFDTETGEAGVQTRLEAFLDMLNMKREKTGCN